MEYIIVGLGGMLGSLARFSLGRLFSGKLPKYFPFSTFIINISGAVLLGIVSSTSVNGDLYRFFADGFLGAYTTFSTFMYEGFDLFKNKKSLNAVIYVVGSIFTGVCGFVLGSLIMSK